MMRKLSQHQLTHQHRHLGNKMALRTATMSDGAALTTYFLDKMLEMRTAIPGVIKKVNVTNGSLISVDVEVSIFKMVTDKTGLGVVQEAHPIITGVPFVMPWGKSAGLLLSVPVNIGDDVLVIFADRSIDNWQATGKTSAPAEPVIPRTHDLTDAIAIPGIFNDVTGKTVAQYDSQAISLRNTSGSVSIKVTQNAAIMDYSGTTVTVDGSGIKLSCGDSSITITPSSIVIDSPSVTSGQNTTITGSSFNLAATSSSTSGGDLVTSGGINLGSHRHQEHDGPNTGGPIS